MASLSEFEERSKTAENRLSQLKEGKVQIYDLDKLN